MECETIYLSECMQRVSAGEPYSEQLKSFCVHSHSRGSHKLTQRGVISSATLRTPWRAEARALALALVRARPAAHEAILLEEHGIPQELTSALECHLAEEVAVLLLRVR